MRIADAMRLALGEFADPACRRCGGRGFRGDTVSEDALCRCVAPRIPATDDPPPGALPHPWDVLTRRAQQIHAAYLLEGTTTSWV